MAATIQIPNDINVSSPLGAFYPVDFVSLINHTENGEEFIGFGNPNAKVLIIGKECALDMGIEEQHRIFDICNAPNWKHWRWNIENNADCDSVPNWKETGRFNPLVPYKGDLLKHLPGGHTWRNYQKIIDGIYERNTPEVADFHQYAFVTEFNDLVMSYSKRRAEVQTAISRRCERVFAHAFFRSFPIVIVGCGHYAQQYDINLEQLFDQKWDGHTISLGKNGWINVHRNDSRVLIHTRHLSMCSKDLINEIVCLCKPYLQDLLSLEWKS